MKNKINTKDEADNGGACRALPAGLGGGSPGDGKALEGQEPTKKEQG